MSNATPGARRTRYGVMSAVLLTAVTVGVVVAVVLGGRTHKRFDVTATRQYALSDRSLNLIDSLTRTYEIVVSARMNELDPRARQQIQDVLAEFAVASPRIGYRWIDTASASGQSDFATLITEQLDREADKIAAHKLAIETARDIANTLAASAPAIEAGTAEIINSMDPLDPQREQVEQIASYARVIAESMTAAAASAQAALQNQAAGVTIPDAQAAQAEAGARLTDAASTLAGLTQFLEQLAAIVSQDTAAACEAAAQECATQRDLAAAAADTLDRLTPLDILSIARVVTAQDAVLVVSDAGLTAIDFASLFPPKLQIDASAVSRAELRFAGEDLIATAIGALEDPVRPIVCFVHGESATLFDEQGRPTAVARNSFGRLLRRFALRQITPMEWPVAKTPERPAFTAIDPDGNRPVIWFVIGPPAPVAFDGSEGRTQADRVRIVERMGESIARLADSGENMFISVDTSERPAFGEPDPIVKWLEQFGVQSLNGAAILRAQDSAYGDLTFTAHLLESANTDHPIGRAIDSLRIALPWATEFTLTDDTLAAPLLTIENDGNTWSELQWLPFRYAQAANPFQPMLLAIPPEPNPQRENTEGPWHVAVTIERDLPTDARPRTNRTTQRILAVASPNWFADAYVEASDRVNGRKAWLFPGNAELLDSGLLWLANRDQLIGASPRSQDIARVRQLNPGQVTAIRWALIAGLPIAVLVIGGAIRLIRG